MELFKFIFSKKFVVNLGLAAAVAVVLMVGLFFCLDAYTDHGVTVTVPDFRGVPLADIQALSDTTEFEIVIVDSLYSDVLPRGAVADQDPPAGYQVKRGRKVYLTVNAVLPQQVALPDVRNLSLRQAKAVLESVGLRVGELSYRPDIAKNAVLDQLVRGVSVKRGKTVFHGTVVDLVLGDGLSNTRVPIPYVLYYRLDEAIERIKLSSLNLGTYKVDGAVTDTALVRVYRQIPAFNEKDLLPLGSSIILFLTEDTLNIEYDSRLYAKPLQLLEDSLVNDVDNDPDFE